MGGMWGGGGYEGSGGNQRRGSGIALVTRSGDLLSYASGANSQQKTDQYANYANYS